MTRLPARARHAAVRVALFFPHEVQ